jgi:hypothetical protein
MPCTSFCETPRENSASRSPKSTKCMTMKKIVERRYTRDLKVPRSADDLEMEYSWRCIPVAPTVDDDWVIFDSSGDKKTGWERVRYCEDDDPPEQLKFDLFDH